MVVFKDDRVGAFTKQWKRCSVASGGYSAASRRLHVSVPAAVCRLDLYPCSSIWPRPLPVDF